MEVVESTGILNDDQEVTPSATGDDFLSWITPQLYERYQKWCQQFAALKEKIAGTKFKDMVTFNPDTIDHEIVRHPSDVYYILELYAEAKSLQTSLEHLIDVVMAKLEAMYRAIAVEKGVKVTEAQLKSSVIGHPLYDEMKSKEAVIGYLVSRIQAVREALHSKREMIVTYAVNMRSAQGIVLR